MKIKIGLLGLGTVGCGVINLLQRNKEEITRRTGYSIEVTHAVVRSLDKPRICDSKNIIISTNPEDVVNNPDIDIVLELIGGYEPAKTLVLQALSSGKHVVTANKALLAVHGNELYQVAQEKGKTIAFEASVAGGIPIIKVLREGLAGNSIHTIAGIINGTSNFILTAMQKEQASFESVLKLAQEKGYAEADPSFDINGTDAAHKLTILASIAFGMPLSFDKLYIEGIDKITQEDVAYAEELGFVIKHLGIANRTKQGIELRVHPAFLPKEHILASVQGVMNAVMVESDALGSSLYYGAGAGSEPTASAVVADLIDIIRANGTMPLLGFNNLENFNLVDILDIEAEYYLRLHVENRYGVLSEIAHILAEHKISIEAVVQKPNVNELGMVPLILLLHKVKEQAVKNAIMQIKNLACVENNMMLIRVYN